MALLTPMDACRMVGQHIVKRYNKKPAAAPAEAVWLSDYRALAEFRYQIRCFLRFSEHAAREGGLEPQQHQLLLALRGLPEGREPTIGALAERLQIHHHSAVELLDRLEERGLVRRTRGEDDRRQVFIHLTTGGEKILRELSLHHRTELRSIAPALHRALNALMRVTKDSLAAKTRGRSGGRRG